MLIFPVEIIISMRRDVAFLRDVTFHKTGHFHETRQLHETWHSHNVHTTWHSYISRVISEDNLYNVIGFWKFLKQQLFRLPDWRSAIRPTSARRTGPILNITKVLAVRNTDLLFEDLSTAPWCFLPSFESSRPVQEWWEKCDKLLRLLIITSHKTLVCTRDIISRLNTAATRCFHVFIMLWTRKHAWLRLETDRFLT